jgi:hypothetical protein
LISKNFTDKQGKKHDDERFKSEYKGLIIKKYRQRGDIIIYRDLKNNIEGVIYATSELNENSNIGDTIIKLPNSNLCIVKNKTEQFNGTCYFNDFENN